MSSGYSLTEAEVNDLVEREVKDLFDSFKTERQEVLLVLQFHLHVEQLIERILMATLERGDKLIDNAGLSFHQKLCVVEALNVLDSRFVDALRKLNKLRNSCAHVHSAPLSKSEVDAVGRCLGKTYTEIIKTLPSENPVPYLMKATFAKIGSHMISRALKAEHPAKPAGNTSAA